MATLRSPSVPLGFLFGSLAAYVVDSAYHYPQLPARIASHFGPDGRADGWMEKGAFMVTGLILLGFTTATLAGTGALLSRTPNELINLPNKEYWLAPERRAETLTAVADQMNWIGAATNLLLVALFHQTYRANLTPDPRLGTVPMLYVAAYVAYTVVWCVGLMRRFRRP
jgi:uncharacterized membrane protein